MEKNIIAFLKNRIEEQERYIEELEDVLTELLDGNSKWNEINLYTGLGRKKCEKIESLFWDICSKQLHRDDLQDKND